MKSPWKGRTSLRHRPGQKYGPSILSQIRSADSARAVRKIQRDHEHTPASADTRRKWDKAAAAKLAALEAA